MEKNGKVVKAGNENVQSASGQSQSGQQVTPPQSAKIKTCEMLLATVVPAAYTERRTPGSHMS